MTDNEIIKALECCCDTKNMLCRDDCPLVDYDGVCWSAMKFEVLSLINRQKAEIERLTKENEMVVYTKSNGWGYISFLEFIKNQRAEAIKEFAERLKEELYEWVGADNCVSYPRIKRVLNNLVKEMVGDAE